MIGANRDPVATHDRIPVGVSPVVAQRVLLTGDVKRLNEDVRKSKTRVDAGH